MTKLSDLKALAECEDTGTREWSWCNHRETILKLIEAVELQQAALGIIANTISIQNIRSVGAMTVNKCENLLESL